MIEAQTFIFADLAGYTTLTERDGDEAAADLAVAFCDALNALLPEGAEDVTSLGDACMVRDPAASDAVEFALAAMGLFLLASLVLRRLNRGVRSRSLIERDASGGPLVPAQGEGSGGGTFLLTSYSAGLAVPFLGADFGLLVFNSEMTRLAQETRSLIDATGINPSFFER